MTKSSVALVAFVVAAAFLADFIVHVAIAIVAVALLVLMPLAVASVVVATNYFCCFYCYC